MAGRAELLAGARGPRPISLLAVHQGGGLGGAPVSLLSLLAALDQTRLAPRAAFTEPGPLLARAACLGLPAEVVPTGGAFYYSAHARLAPRMLARFLRTYPSAVLRARRVLRVHRPDVLHLNTSVLLAWGAAAKAERVPVLWMVREVPGPNPVVRRWHTGFILRHARRVVATSDWVRARFPATATVARVHNAVDLAQFRPELLGERASVRAELGIPGGANVVMALGSVQREKGHWLLLDALRRLAQRSPNACLVLVCGGVPSAYRSSLRGRVKRGLRLPLDNLDALLRAAERAGIRDRVVVTGYRDDVPRILAAADVVAFASLKEEGFGRPLIEAMAMRRPVVATAIGPSSEILGSEAGLLVPPDASALAASLAELLGSAPLRERLGEAGRRRVEAHFTLDRQVAEMSALYLEVAEGA